MSLPLPPVDQLRHDVHVALFDISRRLTTLETQVAALAPLQDSDRLAVARVCQAVGATLSDLAGRSANDNRAKAVNQVFRALRQQGWSLDRISHATGYSTRGVASNLERFSGGTSGSETAPQATGDGIH